MLFVETVKTCILITRLGNGNPPPQFPQYLAFVNANLFSFPFVKSDIHQRKVKAQSGVNMFLIFTLISVSVCQCVSSATDGRL